MAMKLSRLLLSTALVLAALAGILLGRPAPVSAATILVPEAYGTIQAAVDAATAGDIISVRSGWSTTENITVTKNLTIMGRTAGLPAFITSPTTNRAFIFGTNYIIGTTAAVNLKLDNLVIDGGGLSFAGPNTVYTGVLLNDVSGAGAGIFNCRIFNFGGASGDFIDCVGVIGTSTVTIDTCELWNYKRSGVQSVGTGVNLTVHHCAISGRTGAVDTGLNGIYIDVATAVVDFNQITYGAVGVQCVAATSVTISNNNIFAHTTRSIGIDSATAAQIIGNNIHSTLAPGLGILNSGVVVAGRIFNNEIGIRDIAIRLQNSASNWDITANNIYNCTTNGMWLQCAPPVFNQNMIYNCNTGIYTDNETLTAHCNAILGNATAGLELNRDGAFNVTNNYWGANSGPKVDGAGPGTGDNIDTNGHTGLIYNPWMQIQLSATPASIVADGIATSTITMDTTRNSAGAVIGCGILDGLQINFTTTLGALTSGTALTSGGRAVTTLRSGVSVGTANLTSEFDVEPTLTRSTAQVVFTTPPAPVNPLVGTGAPTSHGSSMVGPAATTQPIFLPSIYAQSASLSAKTVTPGTPVTVTADIANKSAVNGNKKVTLYVNGQVETTQGITVNSGGSTKLTFNVSRSEPGDYSVYVDGVPAGSFKVELFRESDGILIFSAVLVALAFLVGMVMLWRRQRAV